MLLCSDNVLQRSYALSVTSTLPWVAGEARRLLCCAFWQRRACSRQNPCFIDGKDFKSRILTAEILDFFSAPLNLSLKNSEFTHFAVKLRFHALWAWSRCFWWKEAMKYHCNIVREKSNDFDEIKIVVGLKNLMKSIVSDVYFPCKLQNTHLECYIDIGTVNGLASRHSFTSKCKKQGFCPWKSLLLTLCRRTKVFE